MARSKSPTDNELKKLSIEERHRTVRTIFIGFWITASIWIITDGVVKLTEKPPWVAVVTALIGALGAGAIQTPILWRVRVYVKDWTRRNLGRQADLESQHDPRRPSSGMRPDGTEPRESGE